LRRTAHPHLPGLWRGEPAAVPLLRRVRGALQPSEATPLTEERRLADEHPEDFGGLSLRVGVNTGEMMFASVGHDRSFTVMGDAVNVAARLQGAAPPGWGARRRTRPELLRSVLVEPGPP